jgi:GMP synthase-like glutamine amidotransferase
MKLTIIQTGESPQGLRDEFGRYPNQFPAMFTRAGESFDYERVHILDGEALPDPAGLEGIIITGSAAGVYDDLPWMPPLRAFIRDAYAAGTPMLGVCFGHQIMADALGGDVRKSEKGWGIGRHVYQLTAHPHFMQGAPQSLGLAASHQDQVMAPPDDAEVFLSSDFTPNAGLIYRNGRAISVQPHPEFDMAFSRALVELRRHNPLDDATCARALASLDHPTDNVELASHLARFLKQAA